MTDEYVCKLDESSLQVAREELGEDPKERLGQVQAFREWILQQPHLKCDTGTPYLLRFLRTAKFSQLEARRRLERYLVVKTKNPDWLLDIDMADPKILKFLRDSTVLFLPILPTGQRAVLVRIGCMATTDADYGKVDTFRAFSGILLDVLADERAQVHGCILLFDFTNVPFNFMTFFGVSDIKRSATVWEGAFPARFKGLHYYNIGPLLETLMAIIRPALSKKTRERLFVHSDGLESVYRHIPMSVLPQEYLPDDYSGPCAGSVQQLTEELVAHVQKPEVRMGILHETQAGFGADLSQKAEFGLEESYRKLMAAD